jgi:TonB family protein
MDKTSSSVALNLNKSRMFQGDALLWPVLFAMLFIAGCAGDPSSYFSTEANEKLETLKPSKPRPIEEWTDPSDREVALHLTRIDEHRRKLSSMFSDLWRPKPTNMVPNNGNYDDLVLQLYKKLGDLKWYPPIAVRNRWEGRVIVDVILRETGEFVALNIYKSSGHRLLDQSALETIRQAGPLTLKEPLEHPVAFFRVPVQYELRR